MDGEGFDEQEKYLKEKLESLFNELRDSETKVGDSIAREDYRGAAKAARDAKTAAVDALEAVLEVVRWTPARPLKIVSIGLIDHAEARLRITPGTFTQFFDVNSGMSLQRTYQLIDVLQQLLNEIRAQEIADEIHEVPTWLPKLVKVVGVVAIGALIGAPLAALAVKESAITELIKASIVLSIAALTEWFIGPTVDSFFDDHIPSEPSTPPPSPPDPDPSFPFPEPPNRDPNTPDISEMFDIPNPEAPDPNIFDEYDFNQDPKKLPDGPEEPKFGGLDFDF